MKKIYINKSKYAFSQDAFGNDQYGYFFHYNDPSSHGYMMIMTEEGYYMLHQVLDVFAEIHFTEQ